ncbi:MAG: hypothetical protein ACM3UZ_08850 [Acidobacteriota bacterium]
MVLLNSKKGLALPLVLIFILVMTLLSGAVIVYVNENTDTISRTKSAYGALNIAEAGYNKYLWHLNQDSHYWEKDVALLPAGSAKPGEVVAIKDGPIVMGYVYLTITKPTVDDPDLYITSTGWSPQDTFHKKTIRARIHKRSFTQNVYVSNYEVVPGTDPSDYKKNASQVWWTSSAKIYGPVHTNGWLNIDGSPQFSETLTYSTPWKNGQPINKGSGGCTPIVGPPDHQPMQAPPLTFPASNTQIKDWAGTKYLFTGRTCIYLQDGKITVRNPNYNGGAAKTFSESDFPPDGVIYVQGDQGSDKFSLTAGNVFVYGRLKGKLTIAAENDIYITGKNPTNYNYGVAENPYTAGLTYFNNNLTTSTDMLGLVAGNNIIVMHYGWPNDAGTGSSSTTLTAPNNMTIYAALFALNRAFYFEQWNKDDDGTNGNHSVQQTLTIKGSIIQQFRGPVGTFSGAISVTGYDKDYSFDKRMAIETPPHFVEPVNEGWEVKEWREYSTPSGIPDH